MKLLIITGLYRTGGTLLQKMLDSHPDINIINHGVFQFFKLLDLLFLRKKGCGVKDRPLNTEHCWMDPVYKDLFKEIQIEDKDLSIFFNALEKETLLDQKRGRESSHPTMEWLESLRQNMHPGKAGKVLKEIIGTIQIYRKNREVKYSGFKELSLVQFVEPLVYIPGFNLKAIQIIRDPRAILASRNFSKSFLKIRAGGKPHPILLIARAWRTSIHYKQYLSSCFPGDFLTVYYERLVANPKEEIKRICRFLDIKFTPALLDMSQYKNERGENWRTNTSFVYKGGFDVSTIERWRDILPESEFGTIEYLCRNEMLSEGYLPALDQEKSFEIFAQYQDKKENLGPWTFKFDLLLSNRQKQMEITRRFLNEKGLVL